MSIYVPKKINVGYQNRSGTYTGKLAYVIYYDEKGKLRKEKSWNSWRDENIPNDEFDNVPTEGFVLNKHAGGVENSWGWNARKSYCRVYDPRGFEFEITIENLLYILENCSMIKGKGVEGELIYAWDGKDLCLMPVESPDYKSIIEYTNIMNENLTIKAKDLIVGATYLTKDNQKWIYMGKFDEWSDYCYTRDDTDKVFSTYYKMKKWCKENNKPKSTSMYKSGEYDYHWGNGNLGKRYVFYNITKNPSAYNFEWMSSINKKLISIIDKNCCENYADLFYMLEGTERYSPLDMDRKEYIDVTFEEFFDACTCKWVNDELSYRSNDFVSDIDGEYKLYNANRFDYRDIDSYKVEKIHKGIYKEVLNIFPTEKVEEPKEYNYRTHEYDKEMVEHMIPVTLKEIYEKMQPMVRQQYLKNGRKYEKVWKL